MRKFPFLAVQVLLSISCQAQWAYPPTKTVEDADTYFGKTYNDPYRWLENLKDKDVEATESVYPSYYPRIARRSRRSSFFLGTLIRFRSARKQLILLASRARVLL